MSISVPTTQFKKKKRALPLNFFACPSQIPTTFPPFQGATTPEFGVLHSQFEHMYLCP